MKRLVRAACKSVLSVERMVEYVIRYKSYIASERLMLSRSKGRNVRKQRREHLTNQ
ncbi:hypothetical protein LA303_00340 [Candidatus Sulfidibacterium hydrothermale]|uniref:hypothetical protein n=1 Tax=Candidatus Sulfidibacterium hydrothermale TaxID=2875962 RepID=UPI001F0A920F|nr:hypothetical protein [Candidatus Sulfidibacterium hydrothermale]UBM62445.1 hypothetical protein LA303_00340 [Candidatus Sulfidibacterium hydrothermale]